MIAGYTLNKCDTHVAAVVRLAFNTVVSGWQINTILETGTFHGFSAEHIVLSVLCLPGDFTHQLS